MSMLKKVLRRGLDEVTASNHRFRPICELGGMPADVQHELAHAGEKTSANTGLVMCVALNYGGRAEIVEACRRAMHDLGAERRSPATLREDDIERNLYTHGLPDVDLLIRTSGEMRISNFLLWQIAYSEIYVTPTLFPDFRRTEIFKAIIDYQKRERRFGDVKARSSTASI